MKISLNSLDIPGYSKDFLKQRNNFLRLSVTCAIQLIRKTELAPDQLYRFYYQDEWLPNSPDINPLNYHAQRAIWRLKSVIQSQRWSLNSSKCPRWSVLPASGTDQQSCKKASKVTSSWGWTTWTLSATAEFRNFVAVTWMTSQQSSVEL